MPLAGMGASWAAPDLCSPFGVQGLGRGQAASCLLFARWRDQEAPSEWHLAVVTGIRKKGRVDLCENCRPISLLMVWHKVYAALVHKGLVEA